MTTINGTESTLRTPVYAAATQSRAITEAGAAPHILGPPARGSAVCGLSSAELRARDRPRRSALRQGP